MRPVSPFETATFAEPEPAAVVAVFEPYEVVGPYSNHQSVATPAGFTVPPSVADVPSIALTVPVIAVGLAATAAPVTIAARATARRRAGRRRVIDDNVCLPG